MALKTYRKFKSHKPVRFGFLLVIICFILAITAQYGSKVSADPYDDKINALLQSIAAYRAEGERLNAQAATLQSALGQLSSQKAAIQAQVDISQAKYDQLTGQIIQTEKQIGINQEALGEIFANMYVEAQISPIEMLAGSKNISEYMDRQEYHSSVRDQLATTIASIKELKAALNSQKEQVEKVLADQKAQRDDLAAKETEQQNLLNRTKGNEATYQKLIADSQSQIAAARATQAALAARANNTGGATFIEYGSLGAYPWNSSNCPMWGYLSTGGADGNGGDGRGYGCRQCASYVAWKIAKETGYYYSWGNATNFISRAVAAGYQQSSPSAGSIGVMYGDSSNGGYGHVVWVETDPYVNADGRTVIQISQYNAWVPTGYGNYSVQEISPNAYDAFVKII